MTKPGSTTETSVTMPLGAAFDPAQSHHAAGRLARVQPVDAAECDARGARTVNDLQGLAALRAGLRAFASAPALHQASTVARSPDPTHSRLVADRQR